MLLKASEHRKSSPLFTAVQVLKRWASAELGERAQVRRALKDAGLEKKADSLSAPLLAVLGIDGAEASIPLEQSKNALLELLLALPKWKPLIIVVEDTEQIDALSLQLFELLHAGGGEALGRGIKAADVAAGNHVALLLLFAAVPGARVLLLPAAYVLVRRDERNTAHLLNELQPAHPGHLGWTAEYTWAAHSAWEPQWRPGYGPLVLAAGVTVVGQEGVALSGELAGLEVRAEGVRFESVDLPLGVDLHVEPLQRVLRLAETFRLRHVAVLALDTVLDLFDLEVVRAQVRRELRVVGVRQDGAEHLDVAVVLQIVVPQHCVSASIRSRVAVVRLVNPRPDGLVQVLAVFVDADTGNHTGGVVQPVRILGEVGRVAVVQIGERGRVKTSNGLVDLGHGAQVRGGFAKLMLADCMRLPRAAIPSRASVLPLIREAYWLKVVATCLLSASCMTFDGVPPLGVVASLPPP